MLGSVVMISAIGSGYGAQATICAGGSEDMLIFNTSMVYLPGTRGDCGITVFFRGRMCFHPVFDAACASAK